MEEGPKNEEKVREAITTKEAKNNSNKLKKQTKKYRTEYLMGYQK